MNIVEHLKAEIIEGQKLDYITFHSFQKHGLDLLEYE